MRRRTYKIEVDFKNDLGGRDSSKLTFIHTCDCEVTDLSAHYLMGLAAQMLNVVYQEVKETNNTMAEIIHEVTE